MFVDFSGRSLPASLVLKLYIQAFVDHLINEMDRTKKKVKQCKIRWIFPVSSNLTDSDKQFLRLCAGKVIHLIYH